MQAVSQFLGALNDPKALAAVMCRAVSFPCRTKALKKNKVPTLAVIGDLDPLKTQVDDLKGTLPDLRVVVIEGADHLNAHARPEFIANLRAFLAKNGAKPAAVGRE